MGVFRVAAGGVFCSMGMELARLAGELEQIGMSLCFGMGERPTGRSNVHGSHAARRDVAAGAVDEVTCWREKKWVLTNILFSA